jgi:hypothetical protein
MGNSELADLLAQNREKILALAKKRGARNIRIFGSVSRGEDNTGSDLDLLVDFEPGRSLLDLGGLSMDLQNLLHRKVDVITEAGLRERIRRRVLREARPL